MNILRKLISSLSTTSYQPFIVNRTDYHSHILPGVDDGVSTIEESIAILELFEAAGIEKLWLTPHIMEEYPNEPSQLISIFNELKSSYDGRLELALASENMIDQLFAERLSTGEILPITCPASSLPKSTSLLLSGVEKDKNVDLLLVETSYFSRPAYFIEVIEDIISKGYIPLLAHPERYIYMGADDYKQLYDMGVLFQLNIASLSGSYGPDVKQRAKALLKDNYYILSGSDTHSFRQAEYITSLFDESVFKN
ncbi:MAG: capsular biosynthesis protein [Muribaculaceae bacterium]|nr:capsular biosynthesis protein [Muribaculaceae bacterium]